VADYALPDLVSRLKVDTSGVDAALNDLTKSFGSANIAVIAAGAALGIVGSFAKSAVDAYVTLGDSVINYQRVTGSSAEESSRMIEAFQVLGVGADTAASAMFRFGKNIETHTTKLEADGLVVAKTAGGTVDLTQTLYNLSDAYIHQADPAKQAVLLFDAFGKSGKALIPILEQGSAALKIYAESAGMVFTQDDLNRLKEYQISLAETTQSWEEMKAQIAQQVIPVFQTLFDSNLKAKFQLDGMQKALADGRISHIEYAMAQMGTVNTASLLKQQLGYQFDAQEKVKHAMIEATQTIKDQTAATDLLTTSFDALLKEQDKSLAAEDKVVSEGLKVKESQDRITAAQIQQTAAHKNTYAAWVALNTAITDYGPKSQQAKDAADALTSAQIAETAAGDAVTQETQNQKDSYIALAKAQLDAFIQQETSNGGTRDATAEQKLLIDQLQTEANTLAPGSPLRVYLEQYIKTLRSDIPSDVFTLLHARIVNDSGSTTTAGGTKSYATGGVVQGSYVGQAVQIIAHAGETVTPIGGGGSGGSGATVNLTYHITGVAADIEANTKAAIEQSHQDMRRMLRMGQLEISS
jgi:hypothetical protein